MRERLDLSKEQVAAFESPVRATVIMALRSHKALSARELAEIIAVRPDSLYYHLKFLCKVGLVQVQGQRATPTRPEAVYELTAREFYMDNLLQDPEYDWSVYRSARNVTRMALSRYEEALRVSSPENVRFSFAAGRMSAENLERLKADLRELGRRVLASNDPDGRPVLLTGLIVSATSEDSADA